MNKKERTERQADEIVGVIYIEGDFWCYLGRILDRKMEVPNNFVTI